MNGAGQIWVAIDRVILGQCSEIWRVRLPRELSMGQTMQLKENVVRSNILELISIYGILGLR